jgi:hypothetical protein
MFSSTAGIGCTNPKYDKTNLLNPPDQMIIIISKGNAYLILPVPFVKK